VLQVANTAETLNTNRSQLDKISVKCTLHSTVNMDVVIYVVKVCLMRTTRQGLCIFVSAKSIDAPIED
jgi:hypothetical protein